MTAEEFNAWMEYMQLNDVSASDRLGVSRNSVAKYRTEGAPRTVALACAAILATRNAPRLHLMRFKNKAGVWGHPWTIWAPDAAAAVGRAHPLAGPEESTGFELRYLPSEAGIGIYGHPVDYGAAIIEHSKLKWDEDYDCVPRLG